MSDNLAPARATPERYLVDRVCSTLLVVFDAHRSEFKELTRRAKEWFETRDWHAGQAGAAERLDLYAKAVARATAEVRAILGPLVEDRSLWAQVKDAYTAQIVYRNDEELAETFFNSVTRATAVTEGVDPSTEFVWFDNEILPSGDETPVYQVFHRTSSTRAVILGIFEHYHFAVSYADPEGDADLIAETIERHLKGALSFSELDSIELLESVFYRNKGAYLVGRIRRANRILPLIIPLTNTERGIAADTVLFTEDEVSVVFSFTRFYFFVDVDRPIELIGFLRTILPVKPIHELYIALGFTKHGKTVLYRQIHRHLAHCADRFEISRGERGMVMLVFTLPSLDIVFKVIRDTFDFPKNTSAKEVKKSYRLVSRHDRVGRLIDTQEFEHMKFDRDRFQPALLEELERSVKNSVEIREREVVIKHAYTERRLNPLNLYVTEVSEAKALDAVVDYGNAIRDLAAANIFPGDLLVKNFGVTRHGRVVFYDYDEVCLLTDCRFRRMPPPQDDVEEMAAEPWFYVGPDDVFPEEFGRFLWPEGPLKARMQEVHGDLFGVAFWKDMQTRVKRGELIDVFPYRTTKRFLRPPTES